MLNVSHVRAMVRSVLLYLEPEIPHSVAAEELVLGTAIQESGLQHLRQLGNGPALGLWQCEPVTHDDLWDNYLAYQTALAGKVRGLASQHWWQRDRHGELVRNLAYAAAICRAHYRRCKEPLPAAGDLHQQAALWKLRYNTVHGKGTVAEYIANWRRVMVED